MPTTDFEGFKKNGTTIPVKDSTARTSISAIEEKIPSGASSSNKLATASDVAAKISSTEKGTNNGVATLGNDGRVPTSQLPSYVDDVLEYASTSTFPAEGEAGKIYVALDTNKTYRWGGSEYVEISESIALGETQGTAYEGSKGKANADNITNIQAVIPSDATSSNKLATASDVTAVSDAVSAIKDGTDIDSFGDVESALGDVDTAINGIKDGTDIDSFSDVESALSNKVDKVSGKGLSTNDYDNTAKGVVDNIQDNVKANTQLISDSIWGEGGKNLLDVSGLSYPILNRNATLTYDGYSLILNGSQYSEDRTFIQLDTHAFQGVLSSLEVGKRYRMTMEGSEPSVSAGLNYEGVLWSQSHGTFCNTSDDNKLEFDYTQELSQDTGVVLQIILSAGTGTYPTNQRLKLILQDADILDNTYEPYHESVEATMFPRSEQAVLGAKNLIKRPYLSGTSYTNKGVTFVVNNDGSVTANGTATDGTACFYFDDKAYHSFLHNLIGKKVTLSGGKSNAKNIDIWIDGFGHLTSAGSEATNTLPNDIDSASDYNFKIQITSGTTVTNEVFYPMLRLATDPDDTYAPYAMTNMELTEKVAANVVNIKTDFKTALMSATGSTVTDVESAMLSTYGDLIILNSRINKASNTGINCNVTIPFSLIPKMRGSVYVSLNSPYGAGTASIGPSSATENALALRYAKSDEATYVDLIFVALMDK